MQYAHPSTHQVPTVFGGAFVVEQHADDEIWNPSSSEIIDSLTASFFDEMMKSLRATLGLH
jgi:hypothetical protein